MSSKVIFFIAASVTGLLLFFSGCDNSDFRPGVKELIDKGALVVDVRTPEEFASGHYKGAVNIPLVELESKIELFGDKENNIIVYCRSANRSSKAKEILEKHGYRNVVNGGGLKDMKL